MLILFIAPVKQYKIFGTFFKDGQVNPVLFYSYFGLDERWTKTSPKTILLNILMLRGPYLFKHDLFI